MSLVLPDPCSTVGFASSAVADIKALAARYAKEAPDRSARPQAVARLGRAIDDAMRVLQSGSGIRRSHPSVYDTMSRDGEEWLRVHRYWFGYRRRGGGAVIFTVLDEAADIPNRR